MSAVNFESRAWQKLCYQDNDHQYHVKAYWNEQFRIAGEKAEAARKVRGVKNPFETLNPEGCYNGIRNWYEKGYASPREARYPSIKEDPTAYILAGD
jgi:hypothetical protein